jgi:hypothetical protein
MDVRFETKHGNKAGKHEWLTPRNIVDTLGPFDLDPCFSSPRPWETAIHYYTEIDDGLSKPWFGFVWCNPPYGEHTEKWLERMAEHKRCIGLIFARTETKMFRKYIWEKAKGILFIYGRLTFYHANGEKGGMSAGAPSCLVAWDEEGVDRLKRYNNGKLVLIN